MIFGFYSSHSMIQTHILIILNKSKWSLNSRVLHRKTKCDNLNGNRVIQEKVYATQKKEIFWGRTDIDDCCTCLPQLSPIWSNFLFLFKNIKISICNPGIYEGVWLHKTIHVSLIEIEWKINYIITSYSFKLSVEQNTLYYFIAIFSYFT